jgi:hypothetical protein
MMLIFIILKGEWYIWRICMGGARAVFLFIVGMLLALLAFPIAWGASALLGYVFAIAAIAIGAYLVARRGAARLPLVLGIVLLVVAVPVLLGTLAVHAGLWAISKGVEEASKVTTVSGSVGEGVKAGEWMITVLGVKEATYIKEDNSYYKAKDGYKLVLIRLRIENIGKEIKAASEIWKFVLVTDAKKSYEKAYTTDLTYIWNVTESIKRSAVPYEELDLFKSVAPSTAMEGDLLFQIPSSEEPERLHFKVGIVGGYEVTISLKP